MRFGFLRAGTVTPQRTAAPPEVFRGEHERTAAAAADVARTSSGMPPLDP